MKKIIFCVGLVAAHLGGSWLIQGLGLVNNRPTLPHHTFHYRAAFIFGTALSAQRIYRAIETDVQHLAKK